MNFHVRERELEDAFNLFSRMSSQLEVSYRDLERRVGQLTEELAAAHGDRLQHLIARERMAKRLQGLLEALPGGVVVIDEDGLIAECNPAAIDLLGNPLLGARWSDVATTAFVALDHDGRELTLNNGRRVALLTRPLGEEPGQIFLLTDVTETRALQKALERRNRLTAMGEMLARLAHQVRTPLASALLSIDTLSHHKLATQERVRIAERVRSRLHHLDRMINDMLAFARGDFSTLPAQFTTRELLKDFSVGYEPQLRRISGLLDLRNEVPDATLCGSREALVGALFNLATNAAQTRAHGLVITLEARAESNDMLRLRFGDNGPGIGEENRDRVFEPFFTTRTDGTGLGLAIVRSTVRAHGGNIWIESTSSHGTIFAMELPLSGHNVLASSLESPSVSRLGDLNSARNLP